MAKPKSLLKLALLLGILSAALYVRLGTEFGESLTAPSIRDWVNSFGPAFAPLVYIGIYIVGTVLLVPGVLLSFGGAVLFGVYEGTLYTWIGATIGATLSFLLAKFLGRDFVDQLLGGRFQEFERRLEKHGFTSMLILRLIPLFPFTGINFASGLTRIRFRDYVLATAIGILPGTFVYQFLFAKVNETITNEWQWSDIVELGIAIVLFIAFVWVGGWIARRMQNQESGVRDQESEKINPDS